MTLCKPPPLHSEQRAKAHVSTIEHADLESVNLRFDNMDKVIAEDQCSSNADSFFSTLFSCGMHGAGNATLTTQQEPLVADTAPSTLDLDDALKEIYASKEFNEFIYGNMHASCNVLPPSSSICGDGGENVPTTAEKSYEMFDSFEEMIKGLSAANYYVSLLTREQGRILREIRPNILFEFLSEIARVRKARRMRRAVSSECAFCKNNGENEESYSSHILKDWRGRVVCPVLRAFHCPRCNATGDRAHTIRYCPERFQTVLQRSNSLVARRSATGSLSLGNHGQSASSAPTTPAVAANESTFTTIWSTFRMN